MRVWAYVDGFNLYNGTLARNPSYKWLNLLKLAQCLVPGDDVQRVKFFTAPILPRLTAPDQYKRQILYWRALRTLGVVEIIEGQFRNRERWLPEVASLSSIKTMADAGANVVGMRPRMAFVLKCEEKGTDVNLAAHLVHDAHSNRFDTALVITNDSDLALAIRIVNKEVGKPVLVHRPRGQALNSLRAAATIYREIRPRDYARSQFPDTLTDAAGTFTKPVAWV